MKLEFRQGLVQVQTLPLFLSLSGNTVSLNTSNVDTIVTFAHGIDNYLFIESSDIPSAWVGDFAVGNHWLYWNLNIETGVRTFGSTIHDPTQFGKTLPLHPQTGQMFFSTLEYQMKEWDGIR